MWLVRYGLLGEKEIKEYVIDVGEKNKEERKKEEREAAIR